MASASPWIAWRSIKYEEIYLKAYDSVRTARQGIGQYLQFYNSQRLNPGSINAPKWAKNHFSEAQTKSVRSNR